jgi:hypothetical protein
LGRKIKLSGKPIRNRHQRIETRENNKIEKRREHDGKGADRTEHQPVRLAGGWLVLICSERKVLADLF